MTKREAATKDFMTLVIEDDDLGAKIMNEISRIKTEIGSLITQYTELKAEHARLCKRREEND
jgi:regulator of replication initiation timing